MMIRSMTQGFHAGRVSLTEEEQMDPDRDFSPFNAAYTSFYEELGIFVPTASVRLLGVAMEEGAAYPAYAFIAESSKTARQIVETWQTAPDHNENTSLFAVPMNQIDSWNRDEVTPDIWGPNYLAGKLDPDAKLNLHSTTPWRIALAKAYTKTS